MKLFQKLMKESLQKRSNLIKDKNRSEIIHLVFGKYLLAANTISSGILMVVGDLISQEIEFQKGTLNERYNWRRSGWCSL